MAQEEARPIQVSRSLRRHKEEKAQSDRTEKAENEHGMQENNVPCIAKGVIMRN